MCDCNAVEMENLKGKVRSIYLAFHNAEAELAVVRYDLVDTTKTLDKYRDMYVKSSRINSELRKNVADTKAELSEVWSVLADTKAELSVVRSDPADTTRTLDYRDMHVKMSRANSELRKSVADLNEKLEALTEERDLACELFQSMMREYANLSDRYAKSYDDYKELPSRFVWRNDAEHDKL